MPRIALYPGSFDPFTNGHLSIIRRGLQIFDRLVVAVANNAQKSPLFSVPERLELIREAVGNEGRIELDTFDGLLVEYARRRGTFVILRGLRAVSDFEYEFQLANMNRKLEPSIDTLFMMTGEDSFYIASRFVREVATLGGDVSSMVPPNVVRKLSEKFKRTR
jgi:pantetheine-phosphate adenylyltransferase